MGKLSLSAGIDHVPTQRAVRSLEQAVDKVQTTLTTTPTVTGSKGGNAALASLLSALAGLGLIKDSTT